MKIFAVRDEDNTTNKAVAYLVTVKSPGGWTPMG